MSRLTDISDTDTYGWVVINRKQVHAIQALWDAANDCKYANCDGYRTMLLPDDEYDALMSAVEELRDLLGGDHE